MRDAFKQASTEFSTAAKHLNTGGVITNLPGQFALAASNNVAPEHDNSPAQSNEFTP